MNDLSSFLNKFKHLLSRHGDEKKLVQDIVARITNLSIASEDIEVKNGVAHLLHMRPTLRAHIFMHKEKIVESLTKESHGKITALQ